MKQPFLGFRDTVTRADSAERTVSTSEARAVELKPVFTSAAQIARAAKLTGAEHALTLATGQTQAGDPKLLGDLKQQMARARMGGSGPTRAPDPQELTFLAEVSKLSPAEQKQVNETVAKALKNIAGLKGPDGKPSVPAKYAKAAVLANLTESLSRGIDSSYLDHAYSGADFAKNIALVYAQSKQQPQPLGEAAGAFKEAMAGLSAGDQQAITDALSTAMSGAAAGNVPADYAVDQLQRTVSRLLSQGMSGADAAAYVSTPGYAQSLQVGYESDTRSAQTRANFGIPPGPGQQAAKEDNYPELFKAQVARLPPELQQKVNDGIAASLEQSDAYAVPRDYAMKHLQRVLGTTIRSQYDSNEPKHVSALEEFIKTLSLVALKPAFPRFTRNRPSAATS